MKALKKATNKQLLEELKNRLHHPNATGNVFAADRIYADFMKRVDKKFSYFKDTPIETVLSDSRKPAYLKALSTYAANIDKDKNILASVEHLIFNLDHSILAPTPVKKDGKEAAIARLLVSKQVFVYAKQAFKMPDFSMSSVKLADMSDVLKLAQAIYRGELKNAKGLADFDTVVREDIPASAWDWMQNNL